MDNMMTYDICYNCQNKLHENCSAHEHGLICTCSICNALVGHEIIQQEYESEGMAVDHSVIEKLYSKMAWHIERMNPDEIKLFKENVKNNA